MTPKMEEILRKYNEFEKENNEFFDKFKNTSKCIDYKTNKIENSILPTSVEEKIRINRLKKECYDLLQQCDKIKKSVRIDSKAVKIQIKALKLIQIAYEHLYDMLKEEMDKNK